MKVDIRVDADFIGNPKTQRLIRELGDKVVGSLLSLWGFAAKHRTKGVLHGLTPEDIAMVARWDGDPRQFVSTLVRLRWLEKRGKIYSIHGWEIHQPYAFFAEERSQAARKAVETRWKKQKGGDTGRIRDEYGANTPAPVLKPSPAPVPPRRTGTAASAGDSGPPRPPAPPKDPGPGNGNDSDQVVSPEFTEWGKRLAVKVKEKQEAHGINPEEDA